MKLELGTIHNLDCVKGMNALRAGSVDLVFADPPFNIGYEYDVYEDRLAAEDYLKWSRDWMKAVHRVLKSDGTFWLAIGDDFAAELKIEAQKIGFYCRSWVIWYYTFGVNCTNKFTRSHTHLFHFVKDPQKFTFRAGDLENRVPSARMLIYNDKRAKGDGRLPDDTWIIPPATMNEATDNWLLAPEADAEPETFSLRPQELESRFDGSEDTWYVPRVAGTFKERAGFHGCQMPEQLLGRIIRICSHEGDIVLDPFSGSASTLVTAKKLGRKHIGFDMSVEYAKAGKARLEQTRLGDRLDGSPEPTMDAFRKSQLPHRSRQTSTANFATTAEPLVAEAQRQKLNEDIERGIVEAYTAAHDGYSTDVLLADPDRAAAFASECVRLGLPGSPGLWSRLLLRLRKQSTHLLPKTDKQFSLSFADCEPFLFASEIAWKMLIDDERARSLDDILCDPQLAAEFDRIAGRFAPGFSSLQYRWGALRIRKYAKTAKMEAEVLKLGKAAGGRVRTKGLGKRIPLDKKAFGALPNQAGVYVLSANRGTKLYVGSALSLRDRLMEFAEKKKLFGATEYPDLSVQYQLAGTNLRELMGLSSLYVSAPSALPKFNVPDLRLAEKVQR